MRKVELFPTRNCEAGYDPDLFCKLAITRLSRFANDSIIFVKKYACLNIYKILFSLTRLIINIINAIIFDCLLHPPENSR